MVTAEQIHSAISSAKYLSILAEKFAQLNQSFGNEEDVKKSLKFVLKTLQGQKTTNE